MAIGAKEVGDFTGVLDGCWREVGLQPAVGRNLDGVLPVTGPQLTECLNDANEAHAVSAKSAHVVSMRHVADLESTLVPPDNLTPDRTLLAREDLRRLQLGLDRLPPRCREVVYLRKVEGLSTREVAERMKVTIDTVEQQTRLGIRALNDFMQGGDGKVRRTPQAVILRQVAAK